MLLVFSLRFVAISAAVATLLGFPIGVHAQSANAVPSAVQSPEGMAAESRGGALAPAEMSGNRQKTRAQVRQELEQAQKSGEMDRINEFYGLPRW
ncbi:DUF4148 domain-containing protein [Paraburkholderia phymatum]|nr:DUF4148 domain-containing protein [Paraburkholderia phymatum]